MRVISADIIKTIWHTALFGSMALLSLYLIVFFLLNFSQQFPLLIPVLIGAGAGAWVAPLYTLFIFVGLAPLINGLCVTLSPIYIFHNVLFSCLYLAWFIKNFLLHKQRLTPRSSPGFLADLLSTIIMVSLAFELAYLPADFILSVGWSPVLFDQLHPLHGIFAAIILLQGLFFFRLLEIEAQGKNILPGLKAAGGVIIITVLFFSGVQLLFDVPAWKMVKLFGKRGLYSPFDDINSCGSIIIVLFSVFLFLFYGSSRKIRTICGLVSALLLGCIVLSLSRITILTALLLLLIAFGISRKKKAVFYSAAALMLMGSVLFWSYKEKLPAASIPLVNYSLQKMASSSSLDMRLYRWRVSLDMIKSAPLAGLGIGTYYRRYPDFSAMTSAPSNSRDRFYHGPENAHNYYIQFASDLGLPALLIFMLLLFYVYRAARFSIVAAAHPQPLLAGLVAGISGYLITCLTSHPLLLPVQQFLFWFAVAAAWLLCAPREKPGPRIFSRGERIFLLAVIAAIIAGYLQYWFRPRHVGLYEYGLYPYQQGEQGMFRWTMKDAGMRTVARSDLIKLLIMTNRYTTARNSVSLKLFIDDMLLDERHIIEPGLLPLTYCIPGIKNKEIVIRTAVSTTFNPFRLGISTDNRDLGVGLAPVEFLQTLPEDGIGFYHKEVWHDVKPAGWPLNKPMVFRWMSRQATLPVTEAARGKKLVLFLSAHHPDITTAPVQVTIRGNGQVLQELILSDTSWKKIELTPEQTMPVTALTLRVSRTWNPRLEKKSRDLRDLGVMVAVTD